MASTCASREHVEELDQVLQVGEDAVVVKVNVVARAAGTR
jgi:hypothetical protein